MLGILRETGGGRSDWWPDDGEPVEGVENACDAPTNVPIIPAWDGKSIVGYERANAPARNIEHGRMHLALLQVVDSKDQDTDTLRAALDRYARDWEHELRSQDPGGEYDCTPYVVVDQRQPRGLFFSPRLVKDQIDGFDQITHWAIRGGSKPGTNGEAYLGSNKMAWYSGGMDTFTHETRHMQNRGHSNGGNGSEYGDRTCNLGRALTGINAFHMLGLGLIHRVADIASSATVHLVPVEVEHADMRNGEHHAAKVEHDGRKLLLSLRKTQSQHWCGVRNHEPDTLFIHAPENNAWWRVRSLYKGNTQAETEIDGIVFRNLGKGVVQVVIDGKPPEPVAPKPLPVVPGDQPDPEHSGIWHDPRFEHQGFDLTVHGDRLTGYWFGHHPRGKHGSAAMGGAHSGRRWMILHGEDKGGYIEFKAQSVMNGEPRDEGQGTIRFDGDTALLRWNTDMYGREHYRLERLSPPKENAALYSFGDYSGISVAEYDNPKDDGTIKRETAAYYYGPGMGGQTWFVMDGSREDLRVMSVSNRHRSTHPGEVETLGTAGFEGGQFRMLGRTYDIEPLI